MNQCSQRQIAVWGRRGHPNSGAVLSESRQKKKQRGGQRGLWKIKGEPEVGLGSGFQLPGLFQREKNSLPTSCCMPARLESRLRLLKHLLIHDSGSATVDSRDRKEVRQAGCKRQHNQFSSDAQSCPILCNPMDCGTPGLPVHYQLLELAQKSRPWSRECHPTISSSSLPCLSLSQHQGLLQ